MTRLTLPQLFLNGNCESVATAAMKRVVSSWVHKAHGCAVSDVGLAALLINCFIVFLTSAKFTVTIPLTEKVKENNNKGTHLVIPLDSPGKSTFLNTNNFLTTMSKVIKPVLKD